MNTIKKIIYIVFAIIVSTPLVYGNSFKDETLNYVVSYKWGLIHKDAGRAQLRLTNKGDNYEILLIGTSMPWVDHFYSVRDTLKSKIIKKDLRPTFYSKIAHEDGKYSLDEIIYQYSSNIVGGTAQRTRIDKKGVKTVSEKKLTASGQAFDMLSSFYFMRTLDFETMKPGETVTTTVFSGSKVETLTIRYVGRETLKLRDKSQMPSYKIKFKFTSAGKKKSSDDIDAWISIEKPHIPLQIVGSLPVGQIKCYYIP